MESMNFFKTLLLIFLALLQTAAARDGKPNVIVIFTDDQGSVDAGCYGSEIETPAIDKLASEGVRFTQFYSAAPVCSPSRAGLLTGRYPVRAGVPGNTTSTKGQGGMPTEQVTIAEMLKAEGYATGHIGKWHLGYTPETMPNGQGFDHSFGHMGGCIDNYSHFFYWQGPNRHDLHRNGEEIFADGEFFPDLMVKEAETFIAENKEKPFFIYFAMNVPHYPYQGSPDWLKRYEDLPYPRNLYAAFMSTLDERIGALIGILEKNGLREDTIVIFQSDHGHSTEDRAHNGGGSAGPYRGAKFSLFEGGLRVPAVISWPGKISIGEVRDQIAHGCDWVPTIAELCGVDFSKYDLDGRSIAKVIQSKDAASPHETVHWMVGKGGGAQWAVRQGDWKLIGNPRDTGKPQKGEKPGRLWLSNLADDIGEMKNHAKANPDVVERLKKEHAEFLKKAQP